jgi:hypothetical protein
MLRSLVRLVRLASLAICVIVLASFAIFVVNQSKSASAHQTQEILTGPASSSSGAHPKATHESGLHKTIDEASEKLTSPFAGVISGSSSEWVVRGVKLLLALAIYGFGVGYLARVVLVRV